MYAVCRRHNGGVEAQRWLEERVHSTSLWQGHPDGIHDVGVLVSEEFVGKVVEVKGMSECLMMVISYYAPQVG